MQVPAWASVGRVSESRTNLACCLRPAALACAAAPVMGGARAGPELDRLLDSRKVADERCAMPSENRPLTEALPVPPHLYDGYQVHRAALAHGLNVLALPRQVLLVGVDEVVPAALSFTHGVPEASTVAAVTFAQDRRLRRALTERAGLPVPRGATFSFRAAEKAGVWAEQLGFPVVVKETVGENPAKSVSGVASRSDLEQAFTTLRRRDPVDRSPGSNPMIAGYAATRLGFEIDDEGNQVAPARTRFLVEKQPEGTQLRLLVCGGDAPIAVVVDTASGLGIRDVSGEVHTTVLEIAARAVASVPGLAAGSVDVVLDDHRVAADEQAYCVVEISERIRAESYVGAAIHLGDRIGDALLTFQAMRAGVALGEAQSSVDVTLRVEGVGQATAIADGFADAAAAYGVQASATVVDELEGVIDGEGRASPGAVAAFTEALMGGLLLGDRASCVETRHRS